VKTRYAFLALLLPMVSYGSVKYSNFDLEYSLNTAPGRDGTHIYDRKLLHSIYTGINVTDNFYADVKVLRDADRKFEVTPGVGFIDHAKYLSPYADLKFNIQNKKMHYDLGTYIKVSHYGSLFIESDDFLNKTLTAFAVGVSVPVYKGLYTKVTYTINTKQFDNDYSVSVGYKFL